MDQVTTAASKPTTFLAKAASELGVDSIVGSTRDTKLLCLQRFIRLFAYGASTLILVLYLSSLGISEARIGLFMTLTLLGDVVISFGLTLFADGLGRRRILVLGAALMSASGVVFAFSGNYWVLVAASIFGVISPRWVDRPLLCSQSLATECTSGMEQIADPVKWQRNRPFPRHRGINAGPAHSLQHPQRHLCLVHLNWYSWDRNWDNNMRLASPGLTSPRRLGRHPRVPSHLWALRLSWHAQTRILTHAK